MKRRTVMLLLLAGLVLALAALPPALPLVMDTRQVKSRLEAVLGQTLGMPVAIRGELGLRLLPMPELCLGGLELGAGPRGPLASCREARLGVSLVRLVQRKLLLRKVVLDSPVLRVERRADGSLDWPLPGPGATGGDSGQGAFAFAGMGSLRISEGSLCVIDAASGARLTLERTQLRYRRGSGFLSLSSSLRLESAAGGPAPRLEAALDSVGVLRAQGGQMRIQNLETHADLVLVALDGKARTGRIGALIDLDTADETLRVSGLDLELGALRLAGSAEVQGLLSAPVALCRLRASALDTAALAAALELPVPAVALGRAVPTEAELELSADREGLEVRVDKASLGRSVLGGRLSRKGWSNPAWTAELDAPRLNLDELSPAAWPAGSGENLIDEPLLERLRSLRLDLGVQAGEVVTHGVRASRLKIALRAEAGLIEGRVERIDFQNGGYQSSLRAEIGQREFSLLLDGRLSAHGRRGARGPAVLVKTLRVRGAPERFEGRLEVDRCDLRELFRVLGVEPHKAMSGDALREASLRMAFQGGSEGLRMPAVSLTLDGMCLEGSGAVEGLGDKQGTARPRLRFDLRAKRLNLAPYLPALLAEDKDAASAPDWLGPDCLLPFHPACPAISGTLYAEEAVLPGASLGALGVKLDMRGDSLRLDAESSRALGGRIAAGLKLGAEQSPRANLVMEARDLDAEQALAFIGQSGSLGRADLLTGRLDATLRGEAGAGGMDEFLRTQRTTLEFSARDGRLGLPEGGTVAFGRLGGRLILAGEAGGEARLDTGKDAPHVYRCALALDMESPDSALRLDLGLAGGLRVPRDAGSLAVTGAGFRLSAKGPALRDARNSLTLRGNLSLDTAKGTLELADLALSGPGLTGRGDLRAQGLGDNPSCAGSLALDRFNPRQTLERAGISLRSTRDPAALSAASAKAAFSLRDRRLDIPSLELELDDFHLAGSASIPDMDKPRLLFDLAGTSFDFDRYRAPPRERLGPPGKDEAVHLPLKLMSRLAFQGRLRLERLVIYRLLFERGEAMLEAADGVYVAKPITAEFHEGPARGEFKAVATPKEFSFETQAAAQGVSFGAFLDAMAGGQYVRGPTDVHLMLRARGATDQELVETLSGNGRLEVVGGSISFSPEDDPPDGAALDLPSLSLDERKFWEMPEDVRRRGRTRFSRATANVTIENGVARNNDLLVRAPVLHGTGSGYVDMNREIVDYTMVFELVNTARVPIHFEGDFNRLEVGVRALDVIGNTATGIVRTPLDILFGILPGIERLIPERKPSERRVH